MMTSAITPLNAMTDHATDTVANTLISQDLDHARETLRLEANALMKQAEILNEDFSKIIDAIMALNGRLIVTGMGKSGHIGKKWPRLLLLPAHRPFSYTLPKPVMAIWA